MLIQYKREVKTFVLIGCVFIFVCKELIVLHTVFYLKPDIIKVLKRVVSVPVALCCFRYNGMLGIC